MFDLFSHNPLVALYLLQAITYGVAATVSRHGNHDAICICYLSSALLHGLLGACHLLHFG